MGLPEHPDANKILEYRAKSQDASERAIQAKDTQLRLSWERVAKGYHDMAERLERELIRKKP